MKLLQFNKTHKFILKNFIIILLLFFSSCSYNEKEFTPRTSDLDNKNNLTFYKFDNLVNKLKKEKNKLNKKYTIIIDPGHGGKDPGAIGFNGTLEKDINLKFAKILKSDLSSVNLLVKLTRANDRYLYLNQRVKFAEKNKADLFISIHADASKNLNARGFSIFSLSDRASDKEAKKLAQRENKSDLIGGLKIQHSDPLIKDNLIKIFQRETMNESSKLANFVITNFKKFPVKNRGHRNAGFVVLKSLTTPSILIELGFLTNKSEEKLLNRTMYLKKLSTILSLSIVSYLNQKS